MRPQSRAWLLINGLLWLSAMCFGQSLGDIARQQRQKQRAKDASSPGKVVTNEDIPESPDASSTPSDETHPPSSSFTGAQKSGDRWKSEIEAQRSTVDSLQKQIDNVNSSIHFVEANRYRNGVQWNEQQIKKQDQVERMQIELEEQKKKLEDMQEAARQQGYGNSVYEP